MDFGKSYRIGNFEVVKLSRSLSKSELKRFRDEAKVPEELRKHLTRGSLPYVKVRAISGIWAIEWSAGTAMFNLFDGCLGSAGRTERTGNAGSDETDVLEGLKGLVSRMYSLCSIVGDRQMNADLTKALSDFLGRRDDGSSERTERAGNDGE